MAISGSDTNNDCTRNTAPCRTIQRAHDVSNEVGPSYALIVVGPGTYDETLTVTKSVSIHADSLTRLDTRLRGHIRALPSAMGVFELHDFTVTPGAGSTVGIAANVPAGARILLLGTAVGGFSSNGVEAVLEGGTLDLTSSSFSSNSADGVRIVGSSGFAVITDSEIMNNLGDGIQFSNANGMDVKIVRTAIIGNGEAGLQLETVSSGSLDVSESCLARNGSQQGLTLTGITGGTITIGRTDFVLNASGGASIATSTVTPDVRNNWWNSATGPSGAGGGSGDSITAGFNFPPFATSPFQSPTICR